jgi:hypothetical protein
MNVETQGNPAKSAQRPFGLNNSLNLFSLSTKQKLFQSTTLPGFTVFYQCGRALGSGKRFCILLPSKVTAVATTLSTATSWQLYVRRLIVTAGKESRMIVRRLVKEKLSQNCQD